MSSAKASSKGAKKIKKFFGPKVPPGKRLKSLIGFTDCVEDSEACKFFLENETKVYSTIMERFSECESVVKKGKHQAQDVIAVLEMLRKYVAFVIPAQGVQAKSSSKRKGPSLEKQRLSIINVIEKSIHFQNKAEVRLVTFSLLLELIAKETEVAESEGSLIRLFSHAINLDVLLDGGAPQLESPSAKSSSTSKPITDDPSVVAPASRQPTAADSVELWKHLLQFISKQNKYFKFWFNLAKTEYLSVFYPAIAKEHGFVSAYASRRTFPVCPYDIQEALVSVLHRWVESLPISMTIWSGTSPPLLMEILRQSCLLPIPYGSTIQLSMEVFRTWLMSEGVSEELLGDKMQEYWRGFISHIALVFLAPSAGGEQLQAHSNLCNEVLDVYGYLCFELESVLSPETWKILQQTLLDTTHTMCSRSSALSINCLPPLIADCLFHSLFLYWMQSPITTPEMWAEFGEKLSALTDWKQLLAQWKEKVLSLTLLLASMTYQRTKRKKRVRDSVFGMHELEEEAQIGLPPDHPVSAINWSLRRLRDVWFIMLNILGSATGISNPTNYTIAMSCVSEVVEFLLRAELRLDPSQVPPVPLFEIFLPRLLEAAAIQDRERNRGRLLAYSTICRLFCRQHVRALDIKFLAHFYRVLKVGLLNAHSSVVWVLIRYATNLFSLALPGCQVLAVDFVSAISRLFDTENTTKPPRDVQHKALTMLSSLICLPNHLAGLSFKTNNNKEMSTDEFQEMISGIFLKALRYPDLSIPKNLSYVVWCLVVLIREELSSTDPRKQVVRDCFHGLIEASKHRNTAVATSALEALSSLSEVQDSLDAVEDTLKKLLVATLSNTTISLIQRMSDSPEANEAVVVAHYHTLLEWLVEGKCQVLDTRSQVEKVFRAVEFGILGEEVNNPGEIAAIDQEESQRGGNKKKGRMKLTSQQNRASSSSADLISKQGCTIYEYLSKAPLHRSVRVREAAELFLHTMLSYYQNFPTIAGAEQIASWTSPKDIDNAGSETLYFMYNNSTILSMQEVRGDNASSIVRITARNSTGKFTWDLSLSYEGDSQNRPKSRYSFIAKELVEGEREPQNETATNTQNQDNADDDSRLDPLDGTLKFLKEMHPETQPHATIYFDQPFQPRDDYMVDVERYKQRLLAHTKKEADLDATGRNERAPLPLRPEAAVPESAIHHVRLFLAHFGFLTESSRSRLHFLDNNARFKRSLKELDKINGREVMKIGVIFVRPGQEDQNSILANDNRSAKYARFCSSLGWSVNLATHAGFMGGLDRKNTTGTSAPYFCTATTEVVFHEITRMPSHTDDPQQIHKKRHVGNDIVHVIWSENHFHDYQPSTISSQFNYVHIIVYPLPSGLFRIQICKKDNVGSFGPLQDGMMISEQLLGPLVRATAINANRAVRQLQDVYKRPYPIRMALINEISQRYKVEKHFDEYLSELFPPTIDEVGERPSVHDIPLSAQRAYRLSMGGNVTLPPNFRVPEEKK